MDMKIRGGFVFVTLFLIVSSTVFANGLSVGQGENYVTIQTGINAVSPCDTVIFVNGRNTNNCLFRLKYFRDKVKNFDLSRIGVVLYQECNSVM